MVVHRSEKLVLVQALDQGTKALALSRVLIDVRAILRHASMRIPPAVGINLVVLSAHTAWAEEIFVLMCEAPSLG